MAYNFTYYVPTKVYFGRKEERNTGRYIREYGAKNVKKRRKHNENIFYS